MARYAIWAICFIATFGVITRPFKLPEAVWAVTGAVVLIVFGLLPIGDAWTAVLKGGDVYLFLIGMMLLSEVARAEGLFDWVAVHAVRMAKGSTSRLFALVFGVALLGEPLTAQLLLALAGVGLGVVLVNRDAAPLPAGATATHATAPAPAASPAAMPTPSRTNRPR